MSANLQNDLQEGQHHTGHLHLHPFASYILQSLILAGILYVVTTLTQVQVQIAKLEITIADMKERLQRNESILHDFQQNRDITGAYEKWKSMQQPLTR